MFPIPRIQFTAFFSHRVRCSLGFCWYKTCPVRLVTIIFLRHFIDQRPTVLMSLNVIYVPLISSLYLRILRISPWEPTVVTNYLNLIQWEILGFTVYQFISPRYQFFTWWKKTCSTSVCHQPENIIKPDPSLLCFSKSCCVRSSFWSNTLEEEFTVSINACLSLEKNGWIHRDKLGLMLGTWSNGDWSIQN